MFGHGQAYDGSQHTSQSPWSATPGSLQEATPQEHRHSQQLYPHASHYQHYTLAHATPAPLYTYPTSQEGFASEESANHPAPSSTVHGLEYAAQPSYDQQKHRLEQATDGEPPSSAGSVGSGSVSSGESAATTGPSNVSQQAKIHDLQHTVPQIPSSTSHTAPSASSFAQSQTSLHSSPLFDVPPGYRTMLSSDKSSSVIQHSNLPNETGGSAPARHNSMPSSAFSSAGGPLALSADVTNIGHLQPQYHSPSQPALQNQPQQMSYGHPPASSSTSSHPFLRTPVPHYTSSPASLLPNSFSQEPHQYQHSQLSPQDSHFHSASSSASGSGSSSLAAHSGSSASSGFQTGLSSDAGLSTKGGRYPLRHPHQVRYLSSVECPRLLSLFLEVPSTC